MNLVDVNVLIGVYRDDGPHHDQARHWLQETLAAGEHILLTPAVVSGFVRIVTNVRVFAAPTPTSQAVAQIDRLLGSRHVSWAMPGARHWRLFSALCEAASGRANLVSDAAIAAVAVEQSATLVTYDRDFALFPGLRWMTPGGVERRN